MDQLFLLFTGVIAIWLSQDKYENKRKYACLFGLASQPFWFYTAIMHDQWGIVTISAFYAYSWFKGFRNFWLNEKASEKEASKS